MKLRIPVGKAREFILGKNANKAWKLLALRKYILDKNFKKINYHQYLNTLIK